MSERNKITTKIDHKRGFTLIEVVVVMAIIAVLAVLVVGAIGIAQRQVRNTQIRSDLRNMQTALEAYHIIKGDYKITDETTILTPGNRERLNDGDFVDAWNASDIKFKLISEDVDPNTRFGKYTIHTSDDFQKYILLAELEGGGPQTNTDITNLLTSLGITGWTPDTRFNYALSNL